MVTRVIHIVPIGHYLRELIIDGETGFICKEPNDFREYAQNLASDLTLRKKMSRAGRALTETKLCNTDEHRKI